MKEKMSCAIYTRVSTDNQAEVEFNSCESQKEKITHFIRSQEGFGVYDFFNDEGYSGKDLNRPALQRMLRDIDRGRINCVITYKMDRLTRSPKDFYHLIEYFDKYKVNFISVTERFDTSTPAGRLLRNIMLTFAQFERELASERTKDKLLQRANKGMWNGGTVPYGYKLKEKKLVIDKKEAKIVVMIYETYVETKSPSEVYEMLVKQGIKGRNGKYMSKSTLYYILRRQLYTGRMKYGGKVYQGNHDPIISEELFNKAQECHKILKKKLRPCKNNLFSGIVKCKECGSIMTPSHVTKRIRGKRRKYRYYRCTCTYRHKWNSCSTRQVSAERLESLIIDDLNRFSTDTNSIENLIYRINTETTNGLYDKAKKFDTGYRTGYELQGPSVKIDPKRFQEQLQLFLKAAAKRRGTDKCLWIKKYVANVLYSKETIETNLYYYPMDNNQEGSLEYARKESATRQQVDCGKSMYSNRVGHQENGRACRIDAGGVGDDPRRSAEGRGAEGQNCRHGSGGSFPTSEELCSERVAEDKKELDQNNNDPVRIFEMAPIYDSLLIVPRILTNTIHQSRKNLFS